VSSNGWKLSGLLATGLALASGCAPAFEGREPGFHLSPSRLVVLPVVTRVEEEDFSGQEASKEEPAEAMARFAEVEVNHWAHEKGASPFPMQKMDSCGPKCDRQLATYQHWSTRASLQIASRRFGRSHLDRSSVADWSSTGDFQALQHALGAEYALIIVLREIRQTPGHALATFVTAQYGRYKRVAAACVASFRPAQMKWCHTEVDAWPYLNTEAITRAAIRQLLSDL
jgi:hypothetical protein